MELRDRPCRPRGREGATFPGGLRTVTQTLPPSKRGRGLALAYSGGSLGAMITPFIVTPIALHFGWHGAFLVTGSFGFAWLILWRFVGKGVDRRTGVHYSERQLPWRHPALWAYIAAYALGAMPLGMILYDSSLYLHARFGWTQATLGKVLWIPPFGWEVGYFFWGAVVDRFGPRFRVLLLCLLLSLPLAWMHSLPTGGPGARGNVPRHVRPGRVRRAVRRLRDARLSHRTMQGCSPASARDRGALWSRSPAPGSVTFSICTVTQTAFRIATLFPIAGYALWLLFSSRYSDEQGRTAHPVPVR